MRQGNLLNTLTPTHTHTHTHTQICYKEAISQKYISLANTQQHMESVINSLYTHWRASPSGVIIVCVVRLVNRQELLAGEWA